MAIEPRIGKTPYQKIFTNKQDLNLFLLKLIELLVKKKITVSKTDIPIGYENYIRVYTREDALADTGISAQEQTELENLPSIKFQTNQTAEFLKNYFNIRLLLGFDTRSSSTPVTIARDLFYGSDASKVFIFCYLQIFKYESTWRTVITKGNWNDSPGSTTGEFKYNVIAQDILGDYFQRGLYKSYITNKKSYSS